MLAKSLLSQSILMSGKLRVRLDVDDGVAGVGTVDTREDLARLLSMWATQLRLQEAEAGGIRYPELCVAVWAHGNGGDHLQGESCGRVIAWDSARPSDLPMCEHHTRRFNKWMQYAVGEALDRRQELVAAAQAREAAERDAQRKATSVVYFVERDGFIKIGVTTQLKKRIATLSRGGQMPEGMSVGPVTLLATMPGDSSNESYLHARFAQDRIPRTEWFLPSDELHDFIEQLSGCVSMTRAA